MPSYTIDDVLTIRELYQDRVLAPPPLENIGIESFQELDAPPRTGDKGIKSCQKLNDKVGLIKANIASLELDAIVNAANPTLLGGGGVDGVIHRAAGPELLEECETLDGCDTGSAKVTKAYRLPCKIIIHAVGPVAYRHSPEERKILLRGCYQTALELLVERNLKTIAFPCISTGIYGYPPDEAADIAAKTVRAFLESDDGKQIEMVAFVMFESKDWNAYKDAIPKYFPPTQSDLAGPHESEDDEDDDDEPESDSDDDQFSHSQPTNL